MLKHAEVEDLGINKGGKKGKNHELLRPDGGGATNLPPIDDIDSDSPVAAVDDVPLEPLEGKKIPQVVTEDRKWPKLPRTIKDWEQFWEVFKDFTPAQWSHCNPYLYRTYPRILKPKPTFIDKYYGTSEGKDPRFSREHIVENHGGGGYKLCISDSDIQKEVCHVFFDISFEEAYPILDYDELDMQSEKNRDYIKYLKKEGVINEKGEIMAQVQAANAANAGETIGAVHKLILDLQNRGGQGNDVVIKMLGDMVSKLTSNPPKAENKVGELAELVKLIGAMQPAPQPKDDSSSQLFLLMIKGLQDQAKGLQDQNAALIQTLLKEKSQPTVTTPASDPISQMDKVLEFLGKIEDRVAARLSNGSNSEKEDEPQRKKTWVDLAEAAIPTLAAVLGGVVQAQMAGGQVPTPMVGGGQVVPITVGQGGADMSILAQQFRFLLSKHGQRIIDAIYQETPGDVFADSFVAMVGEKGWEEVASLGIDGIIKVFQSLPDFWAKLQGREQAVRKFVEEFVGWGDDGKVEGEVD